MSASGSKAAPSVGFLTVCEHEGQGLFGGYLLLNITGRPLEFYCTAPLRTNRAQEILYGATLKPYLYGEQIGQALLEKAKTKPLVVFTDMEAALAVREFVSYPVAYVVGREPAAVASSSPDSGDARSGQAGGVKLQHFAIGGQAFAVSAAFSTDADEVTTRWRSYAADFDVGEPFQRIRDAIDEARRSAKQAA